MSSFAIASYTIVGKQKKLEDGRRINVAQVIMGNATDTYPAGGLALAGGKLGCPVNVDVVNVIDDGSAGISWKYDSVALKMRAFVTGSHAHDLLLKDGAVVDGTTTRANAGTNLLGANTGSNITVAGGGANGGVVLKSDVKLTEASTSFVLPTHTILIEVIGY